MNLFKIIEFSSASRIFKLVSLLLELLGFETVTGTGDDVKTGVFVKFQGM